LYLYSITPITSKTTRQTHGGVFGDYSVYCGVIPTGSDVTRALIGYDAPL